MTYEQCRKIIMTSLGFVLCFLVAETPSAELIISQDPGGIGQPINFMANGQLDLAPADGVAEFLVDFSPKFLANPLGDNSPFQSLRTVDWGSGQDLDGITVTEFVSDGSDQVVPIAEFEPVSLFETGYIAGDVPFLAPFPFEVRQFGVRIEGLQGGPIVTFMKDAQTNGRGGGQVDLAATAYDLVMYDNLEDSTETLAFERLGGGELNWHEDGLNFRSNNASGVRIGTPTGRELAESDSWSIRAHFTVNEVLGLGLAGVGIPSPDRWAAVLGAAADEEFAVGQDFSPQKVAITNGEILDDPFVVQLDFSENELTGHFWRSDSPADVTTIEYQGIFSDRPGPLHLANNGADITYHELWVSHQHIPLPTGFEALGDFNANAILDPFDLQFIAANIQTSSVHTDLNSDGTVDERDLTIWVKDYYQTWIGDSNFDGEFNSGDLVEVFKAGEYEDTANGNSKWTTGDWNGDGEFDTSDLVFAFKDGGFEQGPRQAVAAVPEPSSMMLLCLGFLGTLRLRKLV